ncbi:MAG: class I SAM-dependent methyltransferase [Candidatus Binatia bacterium]
MPQRKKPKTASLASRADRYQLYLSAVQSPECDVDFFKRAYRDAYGGKPRVLREDFCGTAAVCAEWVARDRSNRAIGVDLDPAPLAWGREHLLSKLEPEQRERVRLLEADVRKAKAEKADLLAAQNFSFWIFTTREELRDYFRRARSNLKSQGLMVLDMMGGSEVLEEDREDVRREKGFTYIWEQRRFDPISHRCEFRIHFRFRDGSEMRRAFVYKWRLWTMPEVRELLAEAGFSHSEVYWEGTDADSGEGNGVYRRRRHAPAEPAWVAYLVAVK